MKKSWWRVTDPEQLRTLARNCHPRGIREKNLQKSFQKYMDYASDSCSKGSKESKQHKKKELINEYMVQDSFMCSGYWTGYIVHNCTTCNINDKISCG